MATDEVEGTPIVTEGEFDNYEGPTLVEPGEEASEPEEVPAEVKEDPKPEPKEVPQVPEVPDPGEFKPKDYSFNVTIYDAEGSNGKNRKITSIEQWEDLLETDPNLGTPASLLKANRLASKMEARSERDREQWETEKSKFDEYTQTQQARDQTTTRMVSELNYLSDKGELPPIAREYQEADWSDPEVAKQPGVKEQLEVLNYMRDENIRRLNANLQPMTSVLDAYNAMQLDNSRKAQIEAQRASQERRKEAGARVAGSSPRPVSNIPKGISVGRGGSLDDLERMGF